MRKFLVSAILSGLLLATQASGEDLVGGVANENYSHPADMRFTLWIFTDKYAQALGNPTTHNRCMWARDLTADARWAGRAGEEHMDSSDWHIRNQLRCVGSMEDGWLSRVWQIIKIWVE
jgi:hypothetical protein